MHLAAGQEPVAVGVCAHLRQDDTVVGTHRPHHFAITKGVPLGPMAAEMFGKVTGLGRGKGGHMHLFDPEHTFSCSGIIGASLPPACGAALAAKKLGTDRVAVAFFGEGSILTGKPRTATIVAKEHCELLELDRPTLDAITQTHPHVWDVLQEFASQRMPAKS